MSINYQHSAYIFLCSNTTEDECFQRMLFGGTSSYKSKVRNVQIGDALILYNYSSQKFHGIFEATSEARLNINPVAWNGGYPWQVCVKWSIKYNSISKIDFELITKFGKWPPAKLTPEQLNELINIFSSEERLPTEEPNFRKDNPANKLTNDGHFVRSSGEVAIDNWLFNQEIAHGYERRLPIQEVMFCDFFIPIPKTKEYVYIEYWGREDEKYLKRKQIKQELYKKYDFKLIELNPTEVENIDDVFPTKLRNFLIEKNFF